MKLFGLPKILLLIMVLSLQACGFHLRGSSSVPIWFNNVAIVSENNDKQLISILQSRLEGANVQINSDSSWAKYLLIINEPQLKQQIVSVGASTNPRQYILTLTLTFTLQTRAGHIIQAPSVLYVSRQLTLNNDRILASKDEESILIGEMKQDAVTQLINRLSHLKKLD